MTEKTITARDITERLRFWKIPLATDSAWMEEFSIGEGRLDLLTMNLKDWTVRGFEIKISRSDFRADQKWSSYLPFFNYFYFATPPGLLKPEELPDEIGLLEVHDERTVEKKKAKLLQPSFVRETYGERYMTRVMMKFMRDIAWRETRTPRHCPKCLADFSPLDPRASGHQSYGVSRFGSSPEAL